MPSQPAPAGQPETPPATPDTHPIPPYSAAMEAAWRTEFARETEKRYGIPAAQIEAVLAQAQMRDAIVKAMSRPAEAKPWRDYRPIFIQPKRTDDGRAFLARHRDALARAERQYGVPAEIIVSILGVETSYGGNKGSYAGAMGWGQFMPSSYRDYAVDGNGDGKRDLFNDLDDVFASVANYFARKGSWQRGGPVMQRAVRDPGAADFDNPGNSVTLDQTLATLQAKGYRPLELRFVSMDAGPAATLITLEGAAGPEYWIVYNNFKAITTYNISRLYATAVYQLSRAIAGREPEGP